MAGVAVLLAGTAVLVAVLKVRHLSGLRRTRESVTEDFDVLRRDVEQPKASLNGQQPEIDRDGQPEIAARRSR